VLVVGQSARRREIDCEAIGGLGGWKKIAGWEGEKVRSRRSNQPRPEKTTNKLGRIIVMLAGSEGILADWRKTI